MEETKREATNSMEESPLIFFFCVCFRVLCLFSIFVYSVFCTVLCISPFVCSCLFNVFVQVYRPLLPGGNPVAVKYTGCPRGECARLRENVP